VRGMEKLWAVLIRKVRGLEDMVSRVVSENQEELLRAWNHHGDGEDLHTVWKESKILQELEGLLARLDQTSSTGVKRKREREDEEQSRDSPSAPDRFRVNFRVLELSDAPSMGFSYSPSADLQEARLLPGSVTKLVEYYFTYTHCWFPILDKPYTLRKCYERTRSPRGIQLDSSDLAFLWAICAYTTQQIRGTPAGQAQGTTLHAEASMNDMRSTALALIPLDGPLLSLGHVQALLILVLLDLGLGHWSSAWILTGLAVRIALNLDSSTYLPDKRGKNVLQGCFILDTLIAMRLKRRPYLRHDDPENSALANEDGHEEWEPWGETSMGLSDQREPAFVVSCFNRLTELCLIINTAICGGVEDGQNRLAMECWEHLHDLGDRYPFPLLSVHRRAPHQIILQIFHFATLSAFPRRVEAVHAASRNAFEPSWRFLEAMERFQDVFPSGVHAFPSILAGLCHDFCRRTLASTSGSSTLSNAAPNILFIRRLTLVMSRVSTLWPAFKEIETRFPQQPQGSPVDNARAMDVLDGTDTTHKRQRLSEQNVTANAQAGMEFWAVAQANSEAQEMTLNPGTALVSHSLHSFQAQPWRGAADLPDRNPAEYSSIDVDMSASGNIGVPLVHAGIGTHKDATATGPSLMTMSGFATSPSIGGDEIDKLFYEMAHLDTTEWTTGRSQGLQDFGFTDDSTFEAFCNDPDRLRFPDAYGHPGNWQ